MLGSCIRVQLAGGHCAGGHVQDVVCHIHAVWAGEAQSVEPLRGQACPPCDRMLVLSTPATSDARLPQVSQYKSEYYRHLFEGLARLFNGRSWAVVELNSLASCNMYACQHDMQLLCCTHRSTWHGLLTAGGACLAAGRGGWRAGGWWSPQRGPPQPAGTEWSPGSLQWSSPALHQNSSPVRHKPIGRLAGAHLTALPAYPTPCQDASRHSCSFSGAELG